MEKPKVYSDKNSIPSNTKIIDAYHGALVEFFTIENPQYKKNHPDYEAQLKQFLNQISIPKIWIHYPDQNVALETVPEDIYFRLRTSRNRNIISDSEQEKYRKLRVGVAGLSVGSAIISSLVASGGPKNIKIADFDTVEITNLNRIRASLLDFGQNKAHVAAETIWDLDPFAELELLPKELTKSFVFCSRLPIASLLK